MAQDRTSGAIAAGAPQRQASRRPAVPLAAILLAVLSACDDRSPTAPVSTPTTPSPTLVRIELVGPRTMAPSDTIQFRVRGYLSDGSTQDMTSQSAWQSQSTSVLTIDTAGRATAQSLGESVVTARTSGRTVTSEVVVVPVGTFRLSVVVVEAGVVALDVRVEVTDGTGTGLFDITSIRGRYDLYGVAGDIGIRVSGAGYRDHVQRVVVADHTVLGVEVVPAQPRIGISGTYVMTLDADPACREPLPSDLRRRQYTATVTQAGPEVRVALQGASFSVRNGTGNGFVGRMGADSSKVVFKLDDFDDSFYYYFYSNPDVVESLGDSTNLAIVGEAVTTVSPSRLAGTLDGSMRLFQYRQRVIWIAACQSTRHPFVLSR